MSKKNFLSILFWIPLSVFAQIGSVRINEVEPITDDSVSFEFVELYGPGLQTLDGLTLVLFNGINSQSYFAIDLDGLLLDVDGFLLIAPYNIDCADVFIGNTQNWIQDGTDGVALYEGNANDWPIGTLATSNGLIDAIVYGAESNAPGLISVLINGGPIVLDNPAINPSSYARMTDGGSAFESLAYTVQYPTAGYGNAVLPCVAPELVSQGIVLQCLDSSALFSAEFTDLNGEISSYLLADEGENILGVIDTFPFDFSSFPAGEFHVYAASYSHEQSFELNSPIGSYMPYCGSGCFAISEDYARIIRYDCDVPCIAAGISSSEGDSVYRCFQDTTLFSLVSEAINGNTVFILEEIEGDVVQVFSGESVQIETSDLDNGVYRIYALNTPVLPDSSELDSLINIPGYSLDNCYIWLDDTIRLEINYCASCMATSIAVSPMNVDLTFCMENPESLAVSVSDVTDIGQYSYFMSDVEGNIVMWNDSGVFHSESLSPGEYSLFGIHFAYPITSSWQSDATTLNALSDLFYCFELSTPLPVTIWVCSTNPPCQSLFISEYIESGISGRAIELFNPTNEVMDLSGFSLGIFQNGDSSATIQIGLQGLIAPGDAHVIASGGGLAEGFADDTTFQLIFNGNDAVALMLGDSLIDAVGRVGENPGAAWPMDYGSTQLAVLRRNTHFSSPEINWTLCRQQWTFISAQGDISDFNNLGVHNTQSCSIAAFAGFESDAILLDESNELIELVVNISGLADTAFLSLAPIDGNASPGQDWLLLNNGYQMVLPGSSQWVFEIQMIDDTLYEPDVEYTLFQLLDSTGVFSFTVPTISFAISPSDIEYTPFSISDLIMEDMDGNALYSDTYAVIRGVAQGINFNPDGLEFPFTEGGSALRVFDSFNNFGYSFVGGDSLQIWGRMGQFAGMSEFYPDSIAVIAQGIAQVSAVQSDILGEALESHLVRLDCVELIDTNQWIPNGSGFDVLIQGDGGIYTLHIDLNTDIFNAAFPHGRFDITGVVVQFDESSPFNEGYSLWPRTLNDFEDFVTASFVMPDPLIFSDSGAVVEFQNNSQGAYAFLWDFGDGTASETSAPVHFYPYDFISPLADLQVQLIADGIGCSDTSVVSVDVVYTDVQEFVWKPSVVLFPNPFNDFVRLESITPIDRVSVMDISGKEWYSNERIGNDFNMNLVSLPAGVYLVNVSGTDLHDTFLLLKEQ